MWTMINISVVEMRFKRERCGSGEDWTHLSLRVGLLHRLDKLANDLGLLDPSLDSAVRGSLVPPCDAVDGPIGVSLSSA